MCWEGARGSSGAREPEFRPALGVRACVAFPPSPDVPSRAEEAVFFSPTCYLVCTVFKKLGTLRARAHATGV